MLGTPARYRIGPDICGGAERTSAGVGVAGGAIGSSAGMSPPQLAAGAAAGAIVAAPPGPTSAGIKSSQLAILATCSLEDYRRVLRHRRWNLKNSRSTFLFHECSGQIIRCLFRLLDLIWLNCGDCSL